MSSLAMTKAGQRDCIVDVCQVATRIHDLAVATSRLEVGVRQRPYLSDLSSYPSGGRLVAGSPRAQYFVQYKANVAAVLAECLERG